LDGAGGDDTLLGFDGADTLYGGDGDDSAEGMQGDDVFVFGGGKDWFDGGAGVDHVRFGFQKQIGILNLDGSFLKVLDFFGNEATLFDVESLEFSDVTVPTNELVLQLQSGKFSLQVESLTGTGYQLSDQIRSQADTGTARSKVVWFGDDWTESFQTDVGRFLQWSATSPDGNPTVGNLKLPDALKLIESGLSGPDSTLWKDLIALLADMRVGADGQLKFDGYFSVFAQATIQSKGFGVYEYLNTTVDTLSENSPSVRVVKVEDQWSEYFVSKVDEFLNWSRTSPEGNPSVGALSTTNALAILDELLKQDPLGASNLIGLLADFSVSASGSLIFDGNFG